MRENRQDHELNSPESVRAALTMLAFGLFVLTFLVAIERPHWFALRPMSGIANALSLAADKHEVQTARATTERAR